MEQVEQSKVKEYSYLALKGEIEILNFFYYLSSLQSKIEKGELSEKLDLLEMSKWEITKSYRCDKQLKISLGEVRKLLDLINIECTSDKNHFEHSLRKRLQLLLQENDEEIMNASLPAIALSVKDHQAIFERLYARSLV
jgi:hypothetical protein